MIVFWIIVTNVLAFLKGVDFYIISCLTNICSFFLLLLNTNMSKIVLGDSDESEKQNYNYFET